MSCLFSSLYGPIWSIKKQSANILNKYITQFPTLEDSVWRTFRWIHYFLGSYHCCRRQLPPDWESNCLQRSTKLGFLKKTLHTDFKDCKWENTKLKSFRCLKVYNKMHCVWNEGMLLLAVYSLFTVHFHDFVVVLICIVLYLFPTTLNILYWKASTYPKSKTWTEYARA